MTCRRHRRWLGLAGETVQHGLSPARDILAAALGIPQAGKQPPRIVTFPEAVALAALLTALNWRCDVVIGWEETQLYKHAAKAIGEPSYSRWALLNGPFRWWIRYHRAGSSRPAASGSGARSPRPRTSDDGWRPKTATLNERP